MKPGVEFLLLHNGDVLVRVTTTAGEEGRNHISHTASYRLSGNDFCAKAFPIFYQNYRDSWPPPTPSSHAPVDELQPPDADGIRRRHTKGISGG